MIAANRFGAIMFSPYFIILNGVNGTMNRSLATR
jgi:hypothetical protein